MFSPVEGRASPSVSPQRPGQPAGLPPPTSTAPGFKPIPAAVPEKPKPVVPNEVGQSDL